MPAAVAMVLLLTASSEPARAQEFSSFLVDCSGIKLVDAHGVGYAQATTHKYEFSGSCRLYWKSGDDTQTIKVFPVTAKAVWDEKENRLEEDVRVIGAFKWNGKVIGGEVTSVYLCSDDPLVSNSACNGVEHHNGTDLDQLSEPYQQGRPLLAGNTNAFQAGGLSAKHGPPHSGPIAEPPPPKKPKPKPLRSASDASRQAVQTRPPPPVTSAMVADAVIQPAPAVQVRSPLPGTQAGGGVLYLEIAVPESVVTTHSLADVSLEWQWAPEGARLPGRNVTWSTKNMLTRLRFTGREGSMRIASIDVPYTRFAESSRWRLRVSTANDVAAASPWIEFSVTSP
jgi:hypothetical protein